MIELFKDIFEKEEFRDIIISGSFFIKFVTFWDVVIWSAVVAVTLYLTMVVCIFALTVLANDLNPHVTLQSTFPIMIKGGLLSILFMLGIVFGPVLSGFTAWYSIAFHKRFEQWPPFLEHSWLTGGLVSLFFTVLSLIIIGLLDRGGR
ncbi:hypothetical protein [Labrenzia sp. VG12]|uniref:hypothetical protein n=1 Tax=Labrenzia sp. VG12 TaxID=2021862 RepID=UPI000B8C499D|nr:hypothetical protein [Labrenzia sp. VG12]ASP32242.1 hypothetical protein CHH27_02455 [Labrenzia sp. VG12]